MSVFRIWLRRIVLGAIAIAVLALAGLWVIAPQILVLAREGFPGQVWPTSGTYLEVAGAQTPAAPPAGRALPAAAHDRLVNTSGRALLMERDGVLEYEEYTAGLAREDRFNSYSMVKSLIGAMIIRAVADGKIASLDDPLSDYLGPESPDTTIRAVLTMTSGLELHGLQTKQMEDGDFSAFSGVAELHAFGIERLLPRLHPNAAVAGTFRYESSNSAVLGAVLEQVYQQRLPALLSTLIWQPAGAQTASWRAYPMSGGATAYCCLYARPLDWLMVGRYLLDNGTPEAPFLPQPLWNDLFLPALSPEQRQDRFYGYHISHNVMDRAGENVAGPFAYFTGHLGQVVYLLPEQNTVVVRFGAQRQPLQATLYDLF
ncbi:serine hydrolase domain-containing protein [Ketogulonicigenium vulgare]|uniref:serine hydrolase domain-containing protein n=1 Tax=Ketogulonicigenium vulgare TaxID=92945 RepID=UPI00235919BD|nr:serine hydrolase [Ketogulonicigenium vulgare]